MNDRPDIPVPGNPKPGIEQPDALRKSLAMKGIAEDGGILKWRERHPVLASPVGVSKALWLLLTVAFLFALNRLTAGIGENCRWSLFGIWREELTYLAQADSLRYALAALFSGRHSLWLWIYTLEHVIAAAILGWAAAAAISVVIILIRRQLRKETADNTDSRG